METTKKDGFTRVQRDIDGKFNLITAKGKLLSNEWFDWVDYFHDGLAKVQRAYEKYNFIDKKGKLLSNEWFKWVYDFKDGLAVVQRTNDEWAKIDKTGKIVSDNIKRKRNGNKKSEINLYERWRNNFVRIRRKNIK